MKNLFNKQSQEIIFTCDKNQISDYDESKGIFTIDELKAFSLNNPETFIIIKNYAMIKKGEIKYMQ